LIRFIVFIFIATHLLHANIHHYDDSEYIVEINQDEYDVIEEYDQGDDEYRGSKIRYTYAPKEEIRQRPQRINNQKAYSVEHGVLKFSDENQLRAINKEEFAETYSSMQNLSIPYGVPIKVEVDLHSQRMSIYANGKRYYQWKVSTGTWKHPTPRGYYRPQYLKKMHYSKKYDDAPMPHSIFFKGGYAIHGTNSISRLGRKASHGCIRLHPSNAKKLFHLVKNHGRNKVSIVVR